MRIEHPRHSELDISGVDGKNLGYSGAGFVSFSIFYSILSHFMSNYTFL